MSPPEEEPLPVKLRRGMAHLVIVLMSTLKLGWNR